MISVLILTLNEEVNIADCIRSVAWSDDIHVFDSYSTDRTVTLAREAGAHVTQRVFDNYAAHRNAALTALPFRHAWVLILDADERPTSDLSEEMVRVASSPAQGVVAYRIRRRDFFMDTWLKHAQMSPFYIRLVQPSKVRYTRIVNEVLETDGAVADLKAPFDHYPFSKGIAHWFAKHNQYSTLEAKLIVEGQRDEVPSLSKVLRGRDFEERRRHQKSLFYRMPGRPVIKWLYLMFIRGGLLDGRAGVTYSTLMAIYEYMIVLKTRELRRAAEATKR